MTVLHPLMEEKGMTTMRLQRLHLSSTPCLRTLAIKLTALATGLAAVGGVANRRRRADHCEMFFRIDEIENDY